MQDKTLDLHIIGSRGLLSKECKSMECQAELGRKRDTLNKFANYMLLLRQIKHHKLLKSYLDIERGYFT